MSTYAQMVAENRRLEILRVLEQDPDYETNETILRSALAMCGLAASADQVRGDIAWLAEQNLVTERDVSGIHLAKITRRGIDAAQGLARVPGVARPEPEA